MNLKKFSEFVIKKNNYFSDLNIVIYYFNKFIKLLCYKRYV